MLTNGRPVEGELYARRMADLHAAYLCPERKEIIVSGLARRYPCAGRRTKAILVLSRHVETVTHISVEKLPRLIRLLDVPHGRSLIDRSASACEHIASTAHSWNISGERSTAGIRIDA